MTSFRFTQPFGASTTTQASTTFPGFGAPTATSGFSFGAQTMSQPAPAFNFASSVQAPGSTFNFQSTQAPSATTSSSLFGPLGGLSGTGIAPFQLGTMGSNPTVSTAPFNLGLGSFGTTPTQSNTFGGGLSFGAGLGTSIGLPGLQAAQAVVNNPANVWNSLSLPIVFGDERDAILAKWNQLQAFWGTGKAFFAPNTPPVDFTQQNQFCIFKAVGYSCLPNSKPEDGLITLTIGKKESEVRSQQQQLVEGLHRLFGSRPTISVFVEAVKSVPEDRTEVIVYLLERAPTGLCRRIPTNEACAYLEQLSIKPQLSTLSIMGVVPRIAPTKEQIKAYLDNPPAGIDPLLWQQAKLDNPDPENLILVPMIGFRELHHRLKCQEQETKQHERRLDIIAEDIAELQRRNTTTVAKIAEHKRKQLELGHRVLKIMVNQETQRKMGFAIQADEENFKINLERIQAELNAPTQFKGHLNELLSQIRLQNHQQALACNDERYNVDGSLIDDIRQHLKYEQDGISHLVSILKEDLEDLKIIGSGLKEVLDRRRQ